MSNGNDLAWISGPTPGTHSIGPSPSPTEAPPRPAARMTWHPVRVWVRDVQGTQVRLDHPNEDIVWVPRSRIREAVHPGEDLQTVTLRSDALALLNW